MNIIRAVSQNIDRYTALCLASFDSTINHVVLDYTRGETNQTTLLFIEKRNFSKQEAIAILTLRMMMFEEEWIDFKNYTSEDIQRWHKWLMNDYEQGLYFPIIDVKEDEDLHYYLASLSNAGNAKSITANQKVIDFEQFQSMNPLLNSILKASKVKFTRLETEFYLETEKHYILLNWFTTA